MGTERKPFGQWPTQVTWTQGRRIYVVTPYGSALNDAVRGLGGKWDPQARALWVGTGKADQVAQVITQHVGTPADAQQEQQAKAQRREQAADIIARGLAIELSRWETEARAAVKAAGGVWDPTSTKWYLPTPEAHRQARDQVRDLRAARQTRRSQERDEARTAQLATGAERVRAATTRTIITPENQRPLQWHLPRSRRPQAEAAAPEPGSVHVHDNRAWLVLSVQVTPQVDIDDEMTGWLAVAQTVEVEVGPDEETAIETRRRGDVVQVLARLIDDSHTGWVRGTDQLDSRPEPKGQDVIVARRPYVPLAGPAFTIRRGEDGGLTAHRAATDAATDDRVPEWRPLTAEETAKVTDILSWGQRSTFTVVASHGKPIDVTVAAGA